MTPIDLGQFRVSNTEPSPSSSHIQILRSFRLTLMESSVSSSLCACACLSTRTRPCSCLYAHDCVRARGPCQHSAAHPVHVCGMHGLGSCFPALCPLQTSVLTPHPLCPSLLTTHPYSIPDPKWRPAWVLLWGAQSGCNTFLKE